MHGALCVCVCVCACVRTCAYMCVCVCDCEVQCSVVSIWRAANKSRAQVCTYDVRQVIFRSYTDQLQTVKLQCLQTGCFTASAVKRPLFEEPNG